MKSYLGLVSEYAKAHKKKNRLTVICIAISVMLVAAIFGMADMSVKAQINEQIRKNGNFHVMLNGLSENAAQQIGNRSDIHISGWIAQTENASIGETDMFAGLMFCPDCGKKLYRTKTYSGRGTHFYSCSTYHADHRDRECSTHYIGNRALEEIILSNLREAIAYVSQYEDDFIREMSEISITERDRELAASKSELVKAEKRIAELDVIFKRIYEDNISGKLTDERFIKLSGDYEREQDELKRAADALRRDIKERDKKKTDVKNFVAVTKKYTDLQELDAPVLLEFIERIYVSEKDKQTNTQEVEIVYNFIGAFDFVQAAQQSKSLKSTEEPGVA